MPEVTVRPRSSRREQLKLVLASLGIIMLSVMLVLVTVYKFPDSLVGSFLGRKIPFPLVLAGRDVAVTTKELAVNRAAIRRFYESQDFSQVGIRVDFSTDKGKKRLKMRERDLLNKMLEDRVIRRLAHDHGIIVNDDEVQAATTGKMKELGTTDKVEETLARLYGWTIADFQEKIVRPALYEGKLQPVFEKEVNQTEPRNQIDAAKQALQSGQSFDEVVQKFSQGETKNNGGKLGWFELEDLAPELRGPVDTAKLKVPTSVVESDLGFHILYVEDTKLEEGKRLYLLRQIFTRKSTFTDWLIEKIRTYPVSILSGDYEWNAKTGQIEFHSADMRNFEIELQKEAENDPSVLY